MKGKVLVLNADMMPLHMMPLSTISWQDAMCLIYQQKATAIEFYPDIIHSPGKYIDDKPKAWQKPKVVILKNYKYFKKYAKLSKYNIKVRDGFKCQYCNKMFSHKALTVDHVMPKSMGGKHSWINLVAACKPCNQSKKNNHKIVPKKKPIKPTYYFLVKQIIKLEMNINEAWQQYIKQ